MSWKAIVSDTARRQLDKMDRPIAERLRTYIKEKLDNIEDPRSMGDPLHGPEYSGQWRYKVGSYRIIASIQDQILCITVIRVGHRREVYR